MATVQDLINELRGDLDERTPGVWLENDLKTWINHGIHRVLVRIRGTREDWLTKRIKSTDGTLTINGQSYNTSSLKLVSGTSIYTLPPDCVEIRKIEPATQSDKDNGIRFIAKDLAEIEFAESYRLDQSSSRRIFYFDTYGTDKIIYAPTPAQTIEIELFYIRANGTYDFNDTIDVIPHWALNAVKAYGLYRALKSIRHPDTQAELASFREELAEVASFATPRQSTDIVIVESIFDEDDFITDTYPLDY